MSRFAHTFARASVSAALAASLVACGLAPVPLGNQGTTSETPQTTQEPSTTKPEEPVENTSTEPEAMVLEDVESGGEGEVMAQSYDSSYYYEPEPSSTEEYSALQETGYVTTASTPLSTVSADVDTASFTNLRRMLKAGYKISASSQQEATPEDEWYVDGDPNYYAEAYGVIPAGAVRIEEMLNYFSYNYDLPTGKDDFAITARVGACPWNKDTNLLVLGFSTAKEDESVTQKGSNLVFLIDVSGSMDSADKLDLLKDSFGELLKTLGENDRVSIVTYSGQEEVVLDGAKGSDRDALWKAINGLRADGSTNGEAGLRMAYEVAEKNYIEGGVNRIVMASDGDLNVGMTSESDLHDFVEKKRETGIYLSVLGFGTGNYKDNKMETLADHGNGSYHYIDCVEEAERVFGERLTANLVPFANDVKVQLEFNPAQIKAYRLIGYENRTMAAEDFKDDTKDAGEVGPESQFSVVYEIVPVDSKMDIATPELKYDQTSGDAAKASDEWLTAKLRYKTLDGGEAKEQELVVGKKDLADDPGEDWRFAAAVTEFGMILRDSEFKGTSTFESVRELVGSPKDVTRQGFLDLVDMAEKN